MAYATRRRRRRGARSKRLWQSMLRRLRGPQLSVDDLRTFEDTDVDGRDRTDSAARIQKQWDAAERPDLDAPAAPAAAAASSSDDFSSDHDSSDSDDGAAPAKPVDASQPGELTLDAHGRVAVEDANKLDYGYRVFDDIIKGPQLDALREACGACFQVREKERESAYSRGSTYWVAADADRASLSVVERAALDIFDLHSQGASFDRKKSGAEWWTLDLEDRSGSVAWHFDRDYAIEDDVNLGPHVATVTYLTSAGAPTVVVPLVAPSDADASIQGAGGEVFASLPVAGKHMSFDGRYLHAAPESIYAKESDERRVTLLVNVWLDWRPGDAEPLPSADDFGVRPLLRPPSPLDFSSERRIVALPVPTERCAKARTWSFKAGSHKTRIALRLPGALVDAPDAVVLFQEAPGAPALVEVAPRT
jgi:hypothetical protein